MPQTNFPLTSTPAHTAYGEQPLVRHEQPDPLASAPPPARLPSTTEHQSAAQRGLIQLMRSVPSNSSARDDELFLAMPPRHTGSWRKPLPRHSPVAQAAQAAQIQTFLNDNAAGGLAYASLQPEFLGNSRHLSVTSDLALSQRLSELSTLKNRAGKHLMDAELNQALTDALQVRGVSYVDLTAQVETLSDQCSKQITAIHTLRAHALVQVSNDPMSTWMAHQMMHSPQTRDTLHNYLLDTRPLELQIKRNQLTSFSGALNRPPAHDASPQEITDYKELTARADVLKFEIQKLEQVVDPQHVPTGERSLVHSTDVADHYLANRYEPFRTALHDLRNQTDRAVRLVGNSNNPEVHELVEFRKQVHEMVGNMLRAEKQRTASLIDHAFASKHPAHIDFVPEAADNLVSLVAMYKERVNQLLTEPEAIIDARRQLDTARQCHQIAHQQYMRQEEVKQRTGADINPKVTDDAWRTYGDLQLAERIHGPTVSKADEKRATAAVSAEKSKQLQKICEDALYRMLDTKIENTMLQGFVSLSSAPSPKPVGEQTELIKVYYERRVQQLTTQWHANAVRMSTLRQQAQQNGWPASAYADELRELEEARRNITGQISGLNQKQDFLNQR